MIGSRYKIVAGDDHVQKKPESNDFDPSSSKEPPPLVYSKKFDLEANYYFPYTYHVVPVIGTFKLWLRAFMERLFLPSGWSIYLLLPIEVGNVKDLRDEIIRYLYLLNAGPLILWVARLQRLDQSILLFLRRTLMEILQASYGSRVGELSRLSIVEGLPGSGPNANPHFASTLGLSQSRARRVEFPAALAPVLQIQNDLQMNNIHSDLHVRDGERGGWARCLENMDRLDILVKEAESSRREIGVGKKIV